ncbi:MAG: hypothetical protein KF860_05490 [Cyclobacteriaceae bacterium]|nr:hypothetical protein [Cyclobacteriaceae bacterium]
MKLKIHKVLTAGAFIYAFALVFGFYFMVKQTPPIEVSQEEIVMFLSDDNKTDSSNDSNKKTRGVNSRLLVEDDDDSAKDLLNEMNFSLELYTVPLAFHIETYAPFQKGITSPPPKG